MTSIYVLSQAHGVIQDDYRCNSRHTHTHTDRQRSDSIGRTVLQTAVLQTAVCKTVAQKCGRIPDLSHHVGDALMNRSR